MITHELFILAIRIGQSAVHSYKLKWIKSIPYFRSKKLKVHTLWCRIYLNITILVNEYPCPCWSLKSVLKIMESASAVCISISTVLSVLSLSMNNEVVALKLQKCMLPFYFEGHWRVSQNACKCVTDTWSCIIAWNLFLLWKSHKLSPSFSNGWGR